MTCYIRTQFCSSVTWGFYICYFLYYFCFFFSFLLSLHSFPWRIFSRGLSRVSCGLILYYYYYIEISLSSRHFHFVLEVFDLLLKTDFISHRHNFLCFFTESSSLRYLWKLVFRLCIFFYLWYSFKNCGYLNESYKKYRWIQSFSSQM